MASKHLIHSLGAGLLLLGGCLSDGPNQTGAAYLAERGIVLRDPVFDLTLDSLPLEEFRSSLEEPSHLGDTVAMLGSSRGVRASFRMAFSLSNKVFLDSLDSAGSDAESMGLRLQLGFPKWGGIKDGIPQPPQVYLESQITGRDSLKVLATSMTVADSSKDRYNVLVNAYQRAFLERRFSLDLVQNPSDTAGLRSGQTTVTFDTLTLPVSGIFSKTSPDSIQAHDLPNLFTAIKEKRFPYRYVMLHLEPLQPSAPEDSLMLRPAGGIGADYGPALYFGRGYPTANERSTKTRRLEPYFTGSGYRAITYLLEEIRENDSVLSVGPRRNVKFRINRDTLMQRLARHLGTLPPSPRGLFDSRFFIPFAEISLPLDSQNTRIENDYALDITTVSHLDSVAGSGESDAVSFLSLKLSPEGPEPVRWQTLWIINSNVSLRQKGDTLKVAYVKPPADSALRFVRFRRTSDTTRDLDTLALRPGTSRELSVNPGTRIALRVKVDARAEDYDLAFRLRSASTSESNSLKNPETGKPFTDNEDLTSRFLIPGNSSVTLRATEGMQRTFNRTNIGGAVRQEFSMQVVGRGGLDPDSSYMRTYFPILGQVRFPSEDGVIRAKVHILLFPLSQP